MTKHAYLYYLKQQIKNINNYEHENDQLFSVGDILQNFLSVCILVITVLKI